MIYQTEKALKDLGGKVSEDDRKKIEEEMENLRSTLKDGDNDKIKEATEKLQQLSFETFGKVYQQADPNAAAGGQGGAGYDPNYDPNSGGKKDDDVVDAEYEVVDEDEDKKDK